MPVALSVYETTSAGRAPGGQEFGRPSVLEAAADRSALQDAPEGPMLPPAGASRADTVFATVGIVLLLILAIAFVWTLVRQRGR